MKENDAIARFEQAAQLLPARLHHLALQVPDHQKSRIEEIRLRTGHPMTVLLPEGERLVEGNKEIVTQGDIEQLSDNVTGYSRYASAETMAQGYLTAPGGFRVGLCGTAVMEGGCPGNMRDLSSASVRIAREKSGICEEFLPQLFIGEDWQSTLIAASPGLGKTTLLRDLIRNLSNGTESLPAHRVAVVDERGEIAGTYHGSPQLDVGCHTDVLDGCPKALGILMVLRSMNPQIIAVDEITAPEDIKAMAISANCGVKLLATIHGADKSELEQKPLFARLLKTHVFTRCITIKRDQGGERIYGVEEL